MKKKLLNILKNLIIIVILSFILVSILKTTVFASSESVSMLMKRKISGWYLVIRDVSLATMLVLLLIVGMKLVVISVSPSDKSLFKELLFDWIIGLILIFFIHYFIYALIRVNENIVNRVQEWGYNLSGIDTQSDEYDLYESAMSKSYELRFTSGTIGLIMYIMLVFYTYKFVVVYAKRYINVIVLILLAPIVLLITAFRKVLNGKDPRLVGKWLKELVYNIFIQSVHAAFYASLIGLTLKLSDDQETFIGAILTLIIFGVIFSIGGIIRKIFNIVGGKNTIKKVDIYGSIKSGIGMVNDYRNGEGAIFEKQTQMQEYFDSHTGSEIASNAAIGAGSRLMKFKDNVINTAKDTATALDGEKVKVSEEEIQREREKMQNPNLLGKIYNTVQGVAFNVVGDTLVFASNISKKLKEKLLIIAKEVKKNINDLHQDTEMIKRLPIIIKAHDKSKEFLNNAVDVIHKTVIDLEKSARDLLEELRIKINSNSKDIVASVYESEGPQAFLYPKIGSPYMGMSMLAYQKYQKSYYVIVQDYKGKRTLKLHKQNKQLDINGVHKKKKYKFIRFNYASTRDIVQALNIRLVLNNPYLRRMNILNKRIKMGEINLEDFGIRKTKITYTAKVNSMAQMKQRADISLEKYEERKEDSRWAMVTSAALDIKSTVKTKTHVEFQQTSQSIQTNQISQSSLVAQELNKGETAINTVSNEIQFVETKSIVQAIKNNTVTKYEVVKDVVDEMEEAEIKIQSIFGIDNETAIVNLIPEEVEEEHPKVEFLSQVGIVKEDEILQYVIVDNNKIVEQVLDFDGNILESEEDIEEGTIQHIVSMEGTIVEQSITKTESGIFAVNVPELDNGYNEVSSATKQVIDEIHDSATKAVDDNLNKNADTGKIKSKTIDFTQIINGISKLNNSKSEKEETLDELDKILEDIGQTAKAVIRRKSKATKTAQAGDEYTSEDTYRIYISGAVATPGRVDVKIGSRIRDAVNKAGVLAGITDWYGLDKWLGINLGMTIDSPIDKDGLIIWVPRIQDRDDDGPTEEEIEEMLDRCRPKVKIVIEKYLKEHELTDLKSLRKLVHKNMIIYELQKILKGEDITKKQIIQLIEEYIEDPKSKKFLTAEERDRNKKKLANTEENNEIVESNDEGLEEKSELLEQLMVNTELQNLFEELNKNKEKVLAGSSDKEQSRRLYRELEPEEMMKKMTGMY